jgi:hypothetical protein
MLCNTKPTIAAKPTSVNDAQLRSFLLRRLPPAETARLEEAILLEDGFAERLRDEEFDLLDDYAASRLNDEDRAAVERHLLSIEGNLHSLRIARALHGQGAAGGALESPVRGIEGARTEEVDEMPAGRSRGGNAPRGIPQRFVQAAGLLAACAVAVAVIPQWWGSAQRPDSTASVPSPGATGLGAPAATPAPAAVASGATPPRRGALPIVTLIADVARGGPRATLRIPQGASAIRLQTEVPGPSENVSYGVRIDDAAGNSLFEASGLAIHVAGPYRFVEADVPVAALAPGERFISLVSSSAAAAPFSWQVTGVME